MLLGVPALADNPQELLLIEFCSHGNRTPLLRLAWYGFINCFIRKGRRCIVGLCYDLDALSLLASSTKEWTFLLSRRDKLLFIFAKGIFLIAADW